LSGVKRVERKESFMLKKAQIHLEGLRASLNQRREVSNLLRIDLEKNPSLRRLHD